MGIGGMESGAGVSHVGGVRLLQAELISVTRPNDHPALILPTMARQLVGHMRKALLCLTGQHLQGLCAGLPAAPFPALDQSHGLFVTLPS